MPFGDIPRTHSFSLGDFRDFDFCIFRFFVNHHLEKKYELAVGSPNQAIGSLLDLAIKKFHQANLYNQPMEALPALIKAAEVEMREKVKSSFSPHSFYSAQLSFLTPEVINKATEIFKAYYQQVEGKFNRALSRKTFWDYVISGEMPLKLWGGADTIELGLDGIPEVIDYKYYEDQDAGIERVDMDLMPKLYVLLASTELKKLGFKKARFKIKFWLDPKNESYYEEFDLENIPSMEAFFKDRIERVLRTSDLSFCDKQFCRACKSDQREQWTKQLQLKFNLRSAD